MTELEALRKEMEVRFHALEEWQEQELIHETEDATQAIRRHASFLALESVVLDLADRQGIDRQRLSEVLERRVRYFLDSLLHDAENQFPEAAAQLDDRSVDEVSTDKALPPLPRSEEEE